MFSLLTLFIHNNNMKEQKEQKPMPLFLKKVRIRARKVFSLVPPLFSVAYLGCVDMVSLEKVDGKRGSSPERTNPAIVRNGGEMGQKEVLNAIKNMELVTVSPTVFNFLKGDVPVQDKTNVVNAFVFKYSKSEPEFGTGTGNPALDELAFYATKTFSTDFSSSIPDLKKNEPERLTYMQALAYGFAKCGQEGFNSALKMVANMDLFRNNFMFPGLSERKVSLAGPFANMVSVSLVRANKLDKDKALERITFFLKQKEIGAHTKAAILNLVKIVEPSAFPKLIRNPEIDSFTKKQIKAAVNSLLKSKLISEEVKTSLKDDMASALR